MPTRTDPRPNILWLCTDQQRWDTLGCYGNPHVATPALDRLAAEGVRFENAFCQSPVCTPSRASFLTGRYPRTTRCYQNGQSIPEDEVLVTKLLADEGYACGLAGKLHLSVCHPKAAPARERRIDDGYATFDWSHHPAALPSDGGGADNNWPTNAYNRWLTERGAAYTREDAHGSRFVQIGPDAEHHQTTWCAERAISFFENAASFDRPWLHSVNFFDPHHPFDPPASYLERYLERLDDLPLPDYRPGELDDRPGVQRFDHDGAYGHRAGFPWDEMEERDHRLVRAAYFAMCDLIDDQVGRILDALDASGQRENTLVIFMSDHGEMLGDHGIYLKGPFFYEPAVHVPLLVSWRGRIEGGRSVRDAVELVDLAPTLLDAARLPRWPGMQGRTLWPLLAEGEPLAPRDVYCEYYDAMPWHGEPWQDAPGARATMLRTERHKLVRTHVGYGDVGGELYDLEADPGETRNLWADPAHADAKLDLMTRLCDRMAATVDPLPLREGPW